MINNKFEDDEVIRDLLKLIFHKRSKGTASCLFISLHKRSPRKKGLKQTTNEIFYEGYERVAVHRSSANWKISNNQAVNLVDITFPTSQGSSKDSGATYFAIGTEPKGDGMLLFSGRLKSKIKIESGTKLRFPRMSLSVTGAP